MVESIITIRVPILNEQGEQVGETFKSIRESLGSRQLTTLDEGSILELYGTTSGVYRSFGHQYDQRIKHLPFKRKRQKNGL